MDVNAKGNIEKPVFDRQTLSKKFIALLQQEIEKHDINLDLRAILVDFKGRGMSKKMMLESLEKLRNAVNAEIEEDVVLELMDYAFGWCRPEFSIFKQEDRSEYQ